MLGYSDSAKDGGGRLGLEPVRGPEARHPPTDAHVDCRLFHGCGGMVGPRRRADPRIDPAQLPGTVHGGIKFTEQGEVLPHTSTQCR
jgi:phosphoenolpyruvate carboxylase